MKLKIAYILKMYPRFSETFVVNEILELERRGVDVRIYSLRKPDDGRFHANLAQVKANVIYVPQNPEMEPDRIREAHRRLRHSQPASYQQVYDATAAKGSSFALKRFLQAGYIAEHLLRHPVDGMHAHFATSATRVANLVQQLIGLPYSFTAHAKDIFHDSVQPDSLCQKIAAARFVVTVSQFNQQHLQTLLGDTPADVRCLYNGIDLSRFRPSTTPRQPNLILGVGRLVEKKGFDVLIDACALLRQWGLDFRCEIIGKGEKEEALKQQIERLGLQKRVKLAGAKPQDKVLQAYRRAAIFALPCTIAADGNRDGLPTVLLEAMATGLTAVSTNLVGVPEIIDHGQNGLLVPPNDSQALAEALAILLQNPPMRQRLGAGGREKATAVFDVRQNVGQLLTWLAEPSQPIPQPDNNIQTLIDDLPLPQLPVPMPLEEVFAAL